MKKDGMRVIAVVMGEPSSTIRNDEVSSLLDYAFAQYKINKLISKDKVVDTINLDKSTKSSVDIIPLEDISIVHKKIEKEIVPTYDIKYNKLKNEMKVGDVIGELKIMNGNDVIRTVNLTVKENVERANVVELFFKYLKNIVTGNINL